MHFAALTSFALIILSAGQSLAEPAMTATEFEAYATGKTLTYSVAGEIYGAEQYLPGRHVVWAFKDDQCADGIWYENAGLICFAYENMGDPQCWNFYPGATGLSAEFVGDSAGSNLSEVAQSAKPLSCAGPEVGV